MQGVSSDNSNANNSIWMMHVCELPHSLCVQVTDHQNKKEEQEGEVVA